MGKGGTASVDAASATSATAEPNASQTSRGHLVSGCIPDGAASGASPNHCEPPAGGSWRELKCLFELGTRPAWWQRNTRRG